MESHFLTLEHMLNVCYEHVPDAQIHVDTRPKPMKTNKNHWHAHKQTWKQVAKRVSERARKQARTQAGQHALKRALRFPFPCCPGLTRPVWHRDPCAKRP